MGEWKNSSAGRVRPWRNEMVPRPLPVGLHILAVASKQIITPFSCLFKVGQVNNSSSYLYSFLPVIFLLLNLGMRHHILSDKDTVLRTHEICEQG